MTVEICEWDPERDRPATARLDGSERRGCPNPAVFCVGADGDWHLCETCSSLPRFSRFRVKKILRPTDQESAP